MKDVFQFVLLLASMFSPTAFTFGTGNSHLQSLLHLPKCNLDRFESFFFGLTGTQVVEIGPDNACQVFQGE